MALSFATFFAGAVAGAASAIITHPFDVLKTATQLEHIELGEAKAAGAETLKAASSVRSELAMATTAPVHCDGSGYHHHHSHHHSHGHYHAHAQQSMSIGTRALESFRVYRNWLLRNKNEHQCCVNSLRCTANNSLHVLISIYKQHGVANGLYRGLSLRLLMVIPGGAILVTIYETVQRYL
jgi:hypothetical protein